MANAVMDGADAFLLGAETQRGTHLVLTPATDILSHYYLRVEAVHVANAVMDGADAFLRARRRCDRLRK